MTLFRDKPELLPAFRRGDRAALERAYRHFAGDVSRILRLGFVTGGDAKVRVPGLHDDAALADAIQEVFVRAFQERARASYDATRPYRPFLLQIARNLRLDQQRRAGREISLSRLEEEVGSFDLDAAIERDALDLPEPQARREWEGLLAQTRGYIAALDETARRLIELRFVQGRGQEDVAQAMGVTRRFVRTLEERILIGLRRSLGDTR